MSFFYFTHPLPTPHASKVSVQMRSYGDHNLSSDLGLWDSYYHWKPNCKINCGEIVQARNRTKDRKSFRGLPPPALFLKALHNLWRKINAAWGSVASLHCRDSILVGGSRLISSCRQIWRMHCYCGVQVICVYGHTICSNLLWFSGFITGGANLLIV